MLRPILAIGLCAGLLLPAVNALVLPSADPLAEAVGRAREATLDQALRAGFTLPAAPLARPGSPAEALLGLLDQLGHAPTPAELAAVARLDDASPPLRGALARFVQAFAAFDGAARATTASTTDLALVLQAPVLAARQQLLDAGLELRDAVAVTPAAALPQRVAVGPVVLDFGTADDVATERLALVWDQGGNDQHLNNAGGNSGLPAAALFDLAGQDVYGTGPGRSGVTGGGYLGSGFLLDGGGDDLYRGRDDGVNGGAFLGTGFLLDAGGDDVFDSWGWGTNGGGYPGGLGFLVDQGGDDQYLGWHSGVNGGGYLGGSGVLWDAAGDDVYDAWNTAVNGGSVGGQGLLRDDGGRDWYQDSDGGTGWDRTVVPKGANGAQLDLGA